MKESFFVEFMGMKVEQKKLMEQLKDIWRNQGNKMKDLKNVELYYKPEEKACYYVVNEEYTGKFDI